MFQVSNETHEYTLLNNLSKIQIELVSPILSGISSFCRCRNRGTSETDALLYAGLKTVIPDTLSKGALGHTY